MSSTNISKKNGDDRLYAYVLTSHLMMTSVRSEIHLESPLVIVGQAWRGMPTFIGAQSKHLPTYIQEGLLNAVRKVEKMEPLASTKIPPLPIGECTLLLARGLIGGGGGQVNATGTQFSY